MPRVADLKISDDEMRETIESQPAQADEAARQRPDDLQPARQLHGAPHRRLPGVQHLGRHLQRAVLPRGAAVPEHFIPAAMLPQSPGVAPETCIPELVKCVEQYGNVAINLNPDPSAATGPARR
jgi:4-oxalmesaconate hydratase